MKNNMNEEIMLFFYIFLRAVIEKGSQSRVNIPFRVGKGDENLEAKFTEEAKKHGLVGLAGHRSVFIYTYTF